MQARRMLCWILVAAWMALIWYLSDQPDLKSDFEQDFLLRKLAHITEFGILTGLVFYASRFSLSKIAALASAVVWALAYAGIDEWHQTWVTGRVGSLADVGIDAFGVAAAAMVILLLQKTTARRGDGLSDSRSG